MKYFYRVVLMIFFSFISIQAVLATKAPTINCYGLPGCPDEKSNPTPANVEDNSFTEAIVEIISFFLPYVAVVAVISIMISGVLYLLSAGDEDKVNRAKKWIIWSLLGVILSTSSWYIVATLGNLNFTSSQGTAPSEIAPN